jgi:hypothetical protein
LVSTGFEWTMNLHLGHVRVALSQLKHSTLHFEVHRVLRRSARCHRYYDGNAVLVNAHLKSNQCLLLSFIFFDTHPDLDPVR